VGQGALPGLDVHDELRGLDPQEAGGEACRWCSRRWSRAR
jgi:hypothetical protein